MTALEASPFLSTVLYPSRPLWLMQINPKSFPPAKVITGILLWTFVHPEWQDDWRKTGGSKREGDALTAHGRCWIYPSNFDCLLIRVIKQDLNRKTLYFVNLAVFWDLRRLVRHPVLRKCWYLSTNYVPEQLSLHIHRYEDLKSHSNISPNIKHICAFTKHAGNVLRCSEYMHKY
jgi:hypothetical protein